MVELKTDFDQLSRVAYLYNIGAVRVDLMTPLIGGVGGAAPGTAVVSVADHLLGVVLYDADYHMFSLTHLHYVNNTDPLGLWVQSMVGQALARNTKIVALNDIYVVSGPGTTDLFYECAAGAIVTTVAGLQHAGRRHDRRFLRRSRDRPRSPLHRRGLARVAGPDPAGRRRAGQGDPPLLPGEHHRTRTAAGRSTRCTTSTPFSPQHEWLDMYYAVKEDLRRIGLALQAAPNASERLRSNEHFRRTQRAACRNALIDGDAEVAEAAAVEALEARPIRSTLINDVMIPALTVVGNQFQNGEVFLPELMLAGDAAQQVSKHVEAAIVAQGKTSEPKGVVVIGTVQGDIHDIGKNIVVTMLKAHGFRVVDLGRNVAPSGFLTAAQENNARRRRHVFPDDHDPAPMIENTINLFNEVGAQDKLQDDRGRRLRDRGLGSTIGARRLLGGCRGRGRAVQAVLGIAEGTRMGA